MTKDPVKLSKINVEVWVKVEDKTFKNYYEVSNLGRVRSLDKSIVRSNGKPQTVKGKILRTYIGGQGYVRVILCHKGFSKLYQVHKLMLLSFVGKPKSGEITRHLNGNASYNKLYNIVYGTHSENQLDRRVHKTDSRGEKHTMSKLSTKDVLNIRKSVVRGKNRYPRGSLQVLAKKYDVTAGTIGSILRRETWSHV